MVNSPFSSGAAKSQDVIVIVRGEERRASFYISTRSSAGSLRKRVKEPIGFCPDILICFSLMVRWGIVVNWTDSAAAGVRLESGGKLNVQDGKRGQL